MRMVHKHEITYEPSTATARRYARKFASAISARIGVKVEVDINSSRVSLRWQEVKTDEEV